MTTIKKITLIFICLVSQYLVAQVPLINSISPGYGPSGNAVTITGTNFNNTPTGNIVYFGKAKAIVTTATTTQLTVNAPTAASYGPVTVTTNGLTGFFYRPFLTTFSGNSLSNNTFALNQYYALGSWLPDFRLLSMGDFDGDGKSDIVLEVNREITVLKNTSSGGNFSFSNAVSFSFDLGSGQTSMATGDIDSDGKPDIVVAKGNDSIYIFRNTTIGSNISFAQRQTIPVKSVLFFSVLFDIAIDDIDGDGKPDITATDNTFNNLFVFRNTGSTGIISFAPRVEISTANDPFTLITTDLDGDKKTDIVVSYRTGQIFSVYKNTSTIGSVSFSSRNDYAGMGNAVLGDMTGDGKPDITVMHDSTHVSVYANTSAGDAISFTPGVVFNSGIGTRYIALGDMNGDGRADVIANNSNAVSVLTNITSAGNLAFDAPVTYALPQNPERLLIGDLDGNAKPDILANYAEIPTSFSVLFNNKPVIVSFDPVGGGSGTVVTIKGKNFTGVTSVKFGTSAVQSYTVISDSVITAVANAGSAGNVSVSTPDGTATLAGFNSPTITQFSPSSGTTGTSVTITGTNFINITSVTFGDIAVSSFNVVSPTTITAVVATGASGSVTVNTSKGSSSVPGFSFIAPLPGWTEKATNINDDLTDVRFFGNYGVIIGKKGIYYTTTGADDAAGWKPFKMNISADDSITQSHSVFKNVIFDEFSVSTEFYLCGNDTVANKAIFIKINPVDLSYSILYYGETGSYFNGLSYIGNTNSIKYIHAYGRNGLLVTWRIYYDGTTRLNTLQTAGNKNIVGAYLLASKLNLVTDDEIFVGFYDFYDPGSYVISFSNKFNTKFIAGSQWSASSAVLMSADNLVFNYVPNASSPGLTVVRNIKPSDVKYNCITALVSAYSYVGTDKGIYRVIHTASNSAFEYQPTSLRRNIDGIWIRWSTNDTGYAVGKGGLLLKTINQGGASVPFTSISGSGNCVGATTALSAGNSSAGTCQWYLDSQSIGPDCSSFSKNITATGYHTVKYIVTTSAGLSDTSSLTLYISPPPLTNLPVSIADSILCKSEPVIITVGNTQNDFKYELVDSLGASFGIVAGNGGQAVIYSIPVSISGTYSIRVTSLYSPCALTLTKKIKIIVENTLSVFAASKINIATGEQVDFYAHSKDAVSYVWNFGENSNTAVSTDSNPVGISFASTGQKTLTLISISANGCRDTLNDNAIFVYNKYFPDDVCYIHTIDSSRTSASIIYQPAALMPDDGYILNGYSSGKPLIRSRYGLPYQMPKSAGRYLARYSTDGVLKWVAAMYSSTNGEIKSLGTDKKGNIYLAGITAGNATYFYFPNGDSVLISTSFIVKMDSSGNYLWHVNLDNNPAENGGGDAIKMIVQDDGVIIEGDIFLKLIYRKNGIAQTLYAPPDSTGYNASLTYGYILKLKEDGTLLWRAYYQTSGSSGTPLITAAAGDKNGNSYFTGYYKNDATITDVNKINTFTLGSNFSSEWHGFLFKLDSAGKLQWNVHLANNEASAYILLNAIAVDSAGNSFITGQNSPTSPVDSTKFMTVYYGMDSAKVSLYNYFVLKFSPQGNLAWSNGSKYTGMWEGQALYSKDDDIYAVGTRWNTLTPAVSQFVLTSTDTGSINLSIDQTENFIANYSSSGVLKRVVKSGYNQYGTLDIKNILVDSKNNFILSGNIGSYNTGYTNQKIFNCGVKTTEGGDVFFMKANPDFCATSVGYFPACEMGNQKTIISNIQGTVYQWQENTGSGFANIAADDPDYSGQLTNTLSIHTPSYGGNEFRCVVDSNYSSITILTFTNYWKGSVDSSWINAANWSCGIVPNINTDVVIAANGVVVFPTITGTATCNTLSVRPGAKLTLSTNAKLTVRY